MRETLYRICWKSLLTAATGHGSPLPLHIAEAWMKAARCNELHHWIEAETTDA